MDRSIGACGVRKLHDVKEATRGIIATDVQDINDTRVRARDRLKLNDPSKLAFVRTIAGKLFAPNNLHRVKPAGDTARQPDIPVAAAANAPKQFMIRHLARQG